MFYRDMLYLGSAPSDEDCAQVGDPRYHECARNECNVYIAALIAAFGPPPIDECSDTEIARFKVKSNDHDFGRYFEVVIQFNTRNTEATSYAERVENGLQTWKQAGFAGPNVYSKGRLAGIAFATPKLAIQFAARSLQARAAANDRTAVTCLANLQAAYPDSFSSDFADAA